MAGSLHGLHQTARQAQLLATNTKKEAKLPVVLVFTAFAAIILVAVGVFSANPDCPSKHINTPNAGREVSTPALAR